MKHQFTAARLGLSAIAIVLLFSTAARRSATFEERERARLRAHFDTVLVELESRDVSGLTAVQRVARREHVANLRQYRDAGVFPKNHVSREATPVFVDPFGTQCAMGNLIARDNRQDIVDRIARTRNLARIPELASDTALIAWLDANGLTVAEAARIQPQYEGGGCLCRVGDVKAQRWTTSTRGYEVSTFIHGGLASGLIAANLLQPGRIGLSLAGAVVGTAGIGLAASHLSNPAAPRAYAAANGIMAAASIASAWRSARMANASRLSPSVARGDSSGPRVATVISPSTLGLSVRF